MSDERNAAMRLLQALDQQDELTCEAARDRIPLLVEAELAGEDVDAKPEYATLLQHLDRCTACATLYAELAEATAALVDTSERLPNDQPAMPTFFTPARQSEHVVLRVLQGLVRRFELALPVPTLSPGWSTLAAGEQVTLFTDTLSEIQGAPLVSIELRAQAGSGELRVAVGSTEGTPRWQIQATINGMVHTAITDERGIATIAGLPLVDLQNLMIMCSELPAEA